MDTLNVISLYEASSAISAMKQALEALKKSHYYMIDAGLPNQSMLDENFTAITALRAAIASYSTAIEQADKQEPPRDVGSQIGYGHP